MFLGGCTASCSILAFLARSALATISGVTPNLAKSSCRTPLFWKDPRIGRIPSRLKAICTSSKNTLSLASSIARKSASRLGPNSISALAAASKLKLLSFSSKVKARAPRPEAESSAVVGNLTNSSGNNAAFCGANSCL